MLLFLNSQNPLHRLLRRGIVIGFLTIVAIVLRGILAGEVGMILPEWTVPVFTALLAMIDKKVREASEET